MTRIYGIDFTSAPSRAKPITWASARLDGDVLTIDDHARITDFQTFEHRLRQDGPWIAGFDLPFCFAAGFLQDIGWPTDWAALARHLGRLDKADYLAAHTAFRQSKPAGAKHVPRALDRLTGGAPPNNVVNPPVGRMLFEAVPRLHGAGVDLPGLCAGDRSRIVVEAYPALAAKHLIGTTAYKDGPRDDHPRRQTLRAEMLTRLAAPNRFGLRLHCPTDLTQDPKGDDFDAVLCAVQAAWAHRAGLTRPGGPNALRPGAAHPVEGWIADPAAFDPEWESPASQAYENI